MTATNTTLTAKDGAGSTFAIAQATESVSTAKAPVAYLKSPATEALVEPFVAGNSVGLTGLGYAASGVPDVALSFTATGVSAPFTPLAGRAFYFSIWGTFVATIQLERSFDAGANWLPITAAGVQFFKWTAPCSESDQMDKTGVLHRFNCTVFTSGTAYYRICQ